MTEPRQPTKRSSLPWLSREREQAFREAYAKAVADNVDHFNFEIADGDSRPFDRQYAYYAIEFLDMKS